MTTHTQVEKSIVYYRLIALWILCEAMLGGIIHGLRIPVSGLLVGSCAVICICLIAWHVPAKHAIIKATLVVAIFKMMLSPQAPFPAYIALFFQGLVGELLFFNRKFFKLSCVLLAVLALLESGLQRILVLTIIYGNDLWVVINSFFNGLTKQRNASDYSLIFGSFYVGIHLIVGLLVGFWAAALPLRIEKWAVKNFFYLPSVKQPANIPVLVKKKKRLKVLLFLVWLLVAGLYLQSYLHLGKPLLPTHISLKILLRSVIIVLTWIVLVGPLLKMLLHRWLQKKQSRAQQEVNQVLNLIPEIQQIMLNSWKKSGDTKGLSRLVIFSKIVLTNTLKPEIRSSIQKRNQPEIIIFTGPIQSGKTTALSNWIKQTDEAHGILTPVINGKRMFSDISTNYSFNMEAGKEETDTLTIGRFVFSRRNFEKAAKIVSDSLYKNGWLIIDEIGPLELKDRGFSQVLKNTIASRKEKLLLVVREGLAESVISFFGIEHPRIVHTIHELG